MPPGDFSPSAIGRVRKHKKDIFPEINEEYNNIAIARQILDRQTAKIEKITVKNRCRGAEIVYQKDCTDSVVDMVSVDHSGCVLVGAEHQSAKDTIDVDDGIVESFQITKEDCDNNEFDYEQKYAFRSSTALAKIEERIAVKGITFMDSAARTPVAGTQHGTIGIDGVTLEFDEADWNLELISKILYDARQNSIKRPYGVSTGLLWVEQNLNQRKGSGCCTFKSPNGGIDIAYDDQFQQVKDVVGGDHVYLIDPRHVAFWTYNKETSNVFVDKGHDNLSAMREKLPRLTYGKGKSPIYVDVYRQRKCSGTDLSNWIDVFNIKLNFGFFGAPDICGDGNTGVLKFGVAA